MIVRARPDVDNTEILQFINGTYQENVKYNQLLYFNSASNALEFFLDLMGVGKKVGLQVFTCSSVLDAVLRSNCKPVFMDVDSEYFSTSLERVTTIIDEVDILILSHLFGIPNPEYIKIKELCYIKNVILIDDLAQTFHSKINIDGTFSNLEYYSDNYFYSFFYDKPISCYKGGALKVMKELKEEAFQRYQRLSKVSDLEGKYNLKKLYFLYHLLDPNIYKNDFRTSSILQDYLFKRYPIKGNIKLLKILSSHSIHGIISRCGFKVKECDEIKRMSNVEISYINKQMEKFKSNNATLMDFCNKFQINIPVYLKKDDIKCSIGKRCILERKSLPQLNNVEIVLSNWANLIDSKLEYQGGNYIIKNFINVPVWTKDILYADF